MSSATDIHTNWWERSDLKYIGSQLHFAGHNLNDLINTHGTPVYYYSTDRILENIRRIQQAMTSVGLDHQLLYAMKANRHPEILRSIANNTDCGIDACSPGEVLLAVASGFDPSRISLTSTAVGAKDWETYCKFPDMKFNCDSISSIHRIGQSKYRSSIGIRINPAVGVGYNSNTMVQYAGTKPTKFGIYEDRISEAQETAKRYGLNIEGIHMHAGSGFVQSGLVNYRRALEKLVNIARQFNSLEYINIGGGLGVPLTSEDKQINLDDWSEIVSETVGKLGVRVYLEPGDHIVKDAGVLASTVIEVEKKGSITFTFVDAGFNIHPEPAFYDLPCEPVPVIEHKSKSNTLTTIVGNINEAIDIFNRDHPISLNEGETIVFINAGAYGASMSSNHCLRSVAIEHILHQNE